ncbi:hypothetical protein V7793_10740 [Streptomyces sp. KLMMK]|uniref:hypothetical protein n=1 Tax=Streptomyces sp. KLMMK TaxID=3109353 RepID=UPI003008D836
MLVVCLMRKNLTQEPARPHFEDALSQVDFKQVVEAVRRLVEHFHGSVRGGSPGPGREDGRLSGLTVERLQNIQEEGMTERRRDREEPPALPDAGECGGMPGHPMYGNGPGREGRVRRPSPDSVGTPSTVSPVMISRLGVSSPVAGCCSTRGSSARSSPMSPGTFRS